MMRSAHSPRHVALEVSTLVAACTLAALPAADPLGAYVPPLSEPVSAVSYAPALDRSPASVRPGWDAAGVDTLAVFRESLRIGVMDGNPELEFGRIGPVAVDGRGWIHVFDRLRSDIRVFDGDGTLVRVMGRPGSGPGELSSDVQTMAFAGGDTLFVEDPVVGRRLLFGPGGEHVATRRLFPGEGLARRWQLHPNGCLVEQHRWFGGPGTREWLVCREPGGGVRDTLAVFDYEVFHSNTPPVPLLGPRPAWAVLEGGSVVYGVSGPELDVTRIHPDGRVLNRIREDVPPRPIPPGEQSILEDRFREDWAMESGQRIDGLPVAVPEVYPAMLQLLPGPGNTLWIQRMDSPEEVGGLDLFSPMDQPVAGGEWHMYSAEGRPLGVTRFPQGFQPRVYREGRYYGVHTDALGVQRIVRLEVSLP
jgi:hypothetical protein